MATVVSCVSEEKRSTAMRAYQAIYGIGISLGPVVIGKLVSAYSFESAYFITFILMAITAIAAWPLTRRLGVR